MLKQKLFIEQFILIVIIAILHHLALQFYLYWTVAWFDILMHFLGGMWVGLAALWFFFFFGFVYKDVRLIKKIKIFYITIASVVAIGVLWEVFEIYSGIIFFTNNYVSDTSLDLVADTFGGITAFFYAKKYLTDKNE